MIHISRLVGETLMIGDNIFVTVVAVEGDEVVLEINSSDDSADFSEQACAQEELLACSASAD